MPTSLPKKAMKMSHSHYILCRDSISSDKELSRRSRKHKDMFRLIREARSFLSKTDRINEVESLRHVESKCADAMFLAIELDDKQRKVQIEELQAQLQNLH